MQPMNSNRELADSFVQIAMEGFKERKNLIYLIYLIMGYSVWALPVRNQRGELENDYNSVLSGIYDYMRIGLTQLGTRCSDCPREPSKQLIVLESPVKAEAEFI